MSEPIISDVVSESERGFAFQDLLTCEYFQKYRKGYYASRELGLLNAYRNYVSLLLFLNEIHGYNGQHGKSFAKRFRQTPKDWRNCEAIFSEIIVYRHYIRGIYEGITKNIELNETEADIIIERMDGTKAFLEVFCVMPNFPQAEEGQCVTVDIKTHTQVEMASIRQKLLRKISEQKQFSKPRENYAVIEINNATIAGDFTVLSSLSSGYVVTLNTETRKVIAEGYNWENSVFEDPSTEHLKGVIFFSLGDYGSRKFLFNPKFKGRTGNT